MNNDRYPAQVFWSDDDEGYIAVAPDLPGCSAFGETQAAALSQLQFAIDAWKEAAAAAGNPIPVPSNPALKNQYSGRVLLRMPRTLHQRLVHAAELESVSLNQYILLLITWKHAQTSPQATSFQASSELLTIGTANNFGHTQTLLQTSDFYVGSGAFVGMGASSTIVGGGGGAFASMSGTASSTVTLTGVTEPETAGTPWIWQTTNLPQKTLRRA